MQVPSFELYEMRPQLALQLRKTSSDAATSSTLGVLALNALGRGGIGDGWQTGGLNSTAVRVECTADAPVACFADGGCETVWLQSGDCSGHNATLVTLIGKTLAPAVAQLQLSFAARSLRERLYSFFLHVPVWSGSGWQFASIDARLQIHAVADAQRSEVRVGRANEVDLPGSVVEVSHLDQLVVEIGARDVDGAPIHRMGERIAVQIVSLERKPNLTELASLRSSMPLAGCMLRASASRSLGSTWCAWIQIRTLRVPARRAFGWFAQKGTASSSACAPRRSARHSFTWDAPSEGCLWSLVPRGYTCCTRIGRTQDYLSSRS